MKTFVAAGLLPFGALVAFAVPAHAAPSADTGGNAVATINQLKASGADVRVNRIGSGPLDECEVTNVNSFSRPAQIIPIDDDDINVFTTFPKPKVTVTLNCTR
ncbi:hypothetical protein EV589_1649 [Mycobacterium sp. BK558]|uniref:Uncharacterized protein n=1 Tax=Mycolicibacterium chlorophenolicum TaxID=37916 RepID=A0A0J6VB67_9MYCO|nr:hypothetical protein [Mycolicibacterium chlorophenolicum]KMO67449.1 hypothetical protein MCHLDSM_06698 [Mycolicibacterium chlorophenolicum]MBI5338361.1 hypothetical protein [Mycolicibacterium rufum]RZT25900.1 hypothetical protein EV589_1649 [Mycobacterium sp. BK558]